MTGFTKLHSSILTSTVWREDAPTKVVWITMLALTDRDGFVASSLPSLAHLAGVTVEQAQIAIDRFLAPDPHSRSKECEGRRIKSGDGGWFVINYEKYRMRMSPEEIREKNKLRQRRHRNTLSRDKRDKT